MISAGCGLIDGSGETTEPPDTPLADETICGVFPNHDLQETLGFGTYWYDYMTGPTGDVETGESGYSYSCGTRSNRAPFGQLDIDYRIGIHVQPSAQPALEFDDIPVEFPDTARELTFEGVEGEGWVWTFDVSIYVAWRYNDNQVLLARLTYWGPDEDLDEQVEKFHAVLEPALAQIPELAFATPTHVTVPSTTPEAEDTVTSTDDLPLSTILHC
ncbi:hypothetical protein [Actinomyces glycerinitolerans]|uniref:Uncharacterized protein n=1 Tax=Actinomyces glycerinitolerans TaxID=1892869 RepID=A0A1M4RXB8_9ACTO|nr:hypothetical protein [Actinomyces glycerinitolerans]SHE24634.1 Hypothetical protein ACGLYG10_0841 [Actinomyces glycerinitolerans]